MENVNGSTTADFSCVAVLGNDAVSVIGSFVSASSALDRKRVALVDTFASIGVMSFHCISPKGDAQEAEHTVNGHKVTGKVLYVSLKEAIVLGFNKKDQGILETPTKGMTDIQKFNKRTIQQRIGSVMRDIKNALNKREEKENGGAGSTTRALDVRITAFLNDAKKAAQAAEGDAITFDVTKLVKALDDALAIVAVKTDK